MDIKNKKMIYKLNFPCLLDGAILYNPEILILEQFTGFLDSKNNKIFEGDIIKLLDFSSVAVWWSNDSGQWWAIDHPLCDMDHPLIIGNIHENKDLL